LRSHIAAEGDFELILASLLTPMATDPGAGRIRLGGPPRQDDFHRNRQKF
jgi:hypothetical protein